MKELSTRTGYGSCKVCGERKIKICKKVYADGSMHFVDEHNKSWNSSTCPSCYVSRRKLKRRVQKPESASCKECSLEFKPKLSKQKFCSDACRKKHHNDLRVLVKPEDAQDIRDLLHEDNPLLKKLTEAESKDLIKKLEQGYSEESILEQAKKVMETHAAVFKKLRESGD
jgi:protein-arginine kinase activator protein McsA